MSNWQIPAELPDLRRVGVLALDTETKDDRLRADMGSGWPFRSGHLCGVSVAFRADGVVRGLYFPIRHPDTQNFDPEQVYQWLRDHVAADVHFVTQNGLYDFGWLRAEAGIRMPPGERLEEISALATMVDENRYRYGLDALCAWRGLPGKDEALLRQGIDALGLITKRKKVVPQNHLWQLPARYVGPYAEADAVNTFLLRENLDPILDREGTRAAYRLECDLLPLVLEMRLRGIRVDLGAAEQARDQLLSKRDVVFTALSEKLDCRVSMHEIGRNKWLAETFDRLSIGYPRTEKGNPSFAGGQTGWMSKHPHWLPQLITKADKYNNAATKFLQNYILDHAVNGRIHAEIHPHRTEDSGAKSFRFSYSDPPLQQMTSRDKELAPLIRGVFLPEEGQVWAKPDASQQEFRLVVHYANQHKLPKAADAVARYRDDPKADFHALAAAMTGIERESAKHVNFAKIYGAGVSKLADMIGKPLAEAQRINAQYDRELPFLRQLSEFYSRLARKQGFITLYDRARRHFDKFAPAGKWKKGSGPCELKEARERLRDPSHPWYQRGQLYRVDTHTALNALIQGSAARHTKLWMRACWREGIVPLLQMHDCLDCSVSSLEQAEMVARLGCAAVRLDVPMRVDLKFGRTWGDATHKWAELHVETVPTPEPIRRQPPIEPIETTTAAPDINNKPMEIPVPVTAFQQSAQQIERANNETSSVPPGRKQYQSEPRNNGRPIAAYIYRQNDGTPYLRVLRTTTKAFLQFHWRDGQWVAGKPKGPKIPYRLPELLAAAPTMPVFVCEGEKDADNVAALGLVASASAEGAGKWTADLNKWFARKQTVYILEDNDAAGRSHAAKVATALQGIVADIHIVSFPELPEHGDVSDWLDMGGTRTELLQRAQAAPRAQPNGYVLTRASDIVPRPLDWLWPGHLLRGSQELLTGIPGGGKSQIHCALVAYVTTGAVWPDGCNGIPAGNVIMLTAEDCLDQTIVPRLIAAGADCERVFILRKIRKDNKERMFLLSEDLEQLEQIILTTGDVRLITIDPITAYMGGKVDSHRATDVRGQLGPLADLAERMDVALSAITHPPKHSSQRAIDHFIGSQAFIAAARIGHMAVEEIDEDEHGNRGPTGRLLFTNPKNNVSRKMATLAYRVAEKQIDGGIKAPFVTWEEIVDITADQAVAASMPMKKDQGGAVTFLQDILTNGPARAKTIQERGNIRGFSQDQLDRAKKKMGIVAYRIGGIADTGVWLWALPQDAPGTEQAQQENNE